VQYCHVLEGKTSRQGEETVKGEVPIIVALFSLLEYRITNNKESIISSVSGQSYLSAHEISIYTLAKVGPSLVRTKYSMPIELNNSCRHHFAVDSILTSEVISLITKFDLQLITYKMDIHSQLGAVL